MCDAICGKNDNGQTDGSGAAAAAISVCTKVDLVCLGQEQVATVTASSKWPSSAKSFGPENSCIGQQNTDTSAGSKFFPIQKIDDRDRGVGRERSRSQMTHSLGGL